MLTPPYWIAYPSRVRFTPPMWDSPLPTEMLTPPVWDSPLPTERLTPLMWDSPLPTEILSHPSCEIYPSLLRCFTVNVKSSPRGHHHKVVLKVGNGYLCHRFPYDIIYQVANYLQFGTILNRGEKKHHFAFAIWDTLKFKPLSTEIHLSLLRFTFHLISQLIEGNFTWERVHLISMEGEYIYAHSRRLGHFKCSNLSLVRITSPYWD